MEPAGDPYLVIFGSKKRGPGRPRTNDPKSSVSTWLPADEHDAIIKLAHRKEQSVSETVRQILRRQLQREQ